MAGACEPDFLARYCSHRRIAVAQERSHMPRVGAGGSWKTEGASFRCLSSFFAKSVTMKRTQQVQEPRRG